MSRVHTKSPNKCPSCGSNWERILGSMIYDYINDGTIFNCPKCFVEVEITPIEWEINWRKYD